MKTAILTAAMMILMTAANARTIADTNYYQGSPVKTFQASVIKTGPVMIRFSVLNPENDKVILKVYNEDQVKVYQKTVRKSNVTNIGCDMSNAEKGRYTFVVIRNGKEEVKKSIILF
ncbi:MAG TPA: hypothetical protein PLW31_00915 [Bacteroidales bacterium]|nr:hypothetical protein [Bacteroidales bacterium]HNQ82271.1 hypothetical protein [Bacteroidales bacterium]HOX76569.1 hypothetical protein [Bacteroidales bacterium]HPI87560.1 hypothetical protein [Bacteroidales bacterium]HPM92771.1 hypothetical protein [Bacteroidales bacterium]